MSAPVLSPGFTERGARFGRVATTPACDPDDAPVYLHQLQLDRAGYDEGGAYWGVGERVYWAYRDRPRFSFYLRARSRAEAKDKLRRQHPHIRFKR